MSVRQVFALCAVVCALLAPAVAQPNVVLIVADDMGFGDVGYNGSEIATPHLDQLAAEGIVLDRFYTSPLCSPSRAGLLTGRYGLRMGIAEPVTMADTVGLPQAETTLAEALQGAGYETAMVGKWHLGDACHQHPRAHGFDSFLGFLNGNQGYYQHGIVGILDILVVIAEWGSCGDVCNGDFDGNGSVDILDILVVIANWS